MNKSKIFKLSSIIIKKFVSSELIDSPACVLKELIENSLDAGSSKIIIYLENNGLNLIKVIDNGSGIYKNDMKKICIRYNTSKIKTIDDLDKITTYGFRGEALYAIKAISNLEIISKPIDQDIAWKINFETNDLRQLIPENSLNGTTINVKNLNITHILPHFMRNDAFDSIFLTFKIMALSNFNVHFILFKDCFEYINLPPCFDNYSKVKRLEDLGIKNLPAKSFDLNSSSNNYLIKGFFFIDKRKIPSSNNKFFFINDRFINDENINNIITNISKDYLDKNEILYYCFYLYLNQSLFMINFSKKSSTVKFHVSGIYSFIENSLSEALSDNLGGKKSNINSNIKYKNDDKNDYWLMNSSLSNEFIFTNKNEILTVIDNKFLFFGIKNDIFSVLLKNLRGKILLDLCTKQFVRQGNITQKCINIYKFITLSNIKLPFLYKKMFMTYGFDFIIADKCSILIKSVPAVLFDLFVNWDMLFRDLVKFFDSSITNHLSTVRFEKQVIDIFIKHIYDKSPCYNNEIKELYLKLINIKNSDIKWFNNNCFLISCKKLKFN